MPLKALLLVPLTLLFVTTPLAAAGKKAPPPPEDEIESPAYVQTESARLIAPAAAVSTRDVKVLLVTVVPAGSACYLPEGDVAAVDRFTHVISARARAFLARGCAPRRSRFDLQTFDLGRLEPGTHTIKVVDSVVPVAPLTVVVTDGAVALK